MTDTAPVQPGPETARLVGSVIRHRRSCRHFSGEALDPATLHRILEAGIQAPTASNTQNVRFILLTDGAALRHLDSVRYCWPYRSYARRRETDEPGLIGRAAAAILVLTDSSLTGFGNGTEHRIWRESDIQNASAAIENMLLMATALGVGTTWISASEPMSHSRLMRGRSWPAALPDYDIPPDHHVHGIVILGHPRRHDEAGFASGEGMHGVDWTPTGRAPVEAHLIRARAEARDPARAAPPAAVRLQLRILSGTIAGLLACVRRLERLVRRIETPYLTNPRREEGR
jgi:nitroreductase